MTTDLIRFPGNGNQHYRPTDDGLFVLLAVPKPEGWQYGCMVDVDICLSSPDATVDVPADIWEPFDYEESGYRKSFQAKDALDAAGHPGLGNWALRTTSPDQWSSSMLAALHLGSGQALWDDREGRLWSPTVDDLTDAGRVLYDGLQAAYGITPVLITCLDT